MEISTRSISISHQLARSASHLSLLYWLWTLTAWMHPHVFSLKQSEHGGRACGRWVCLCLCYVHDSDNTTRQPLAKYEIPQWPLQNKKKVYHDLSRSMDYVRVITLSSRAYRNEADLYLPDWQRVFLDRITRNCRGWKRCQFRSLLFCSLSTNNWLVTWNASRQCDDWLCVPLWRVLMEHGCQVERKRPSDHCYFW